MKRKKTGFTLVELLTVLAIIVMLVGLLMPAMATVRRFAKETKQRAQLTTIGLALTAFRDDYGDYPPSSWEDVYTYTGAQRLTEALLGWDLLGFHPKSAWRADGYDGLTPNGPWTYDPLGERDADGDGTPDTLNERRGRYLELGTANAFWVGFTGRHDGLFLDVSFSGDQLNRDTFVICDVFGVRRVLVGTKTVKAGTPILYYRANTSRSFDVGGAWDLQIYNAYDNLYLIGLGVLTPDGTRGRDHRLAEDSAYFYSPEYKILDPKVGIPWPHRPDSYILISAGMDGEYGTADDITNFGD